MSSRFTGFWFRQHFYTTPYSSGNLSYLEICKMQNRKSEMRQVALLRRNGAFAQNHTAGEKLAQWFPQSIKATGTIVAGYIPIGSEIDPLPLMRELRGQGAKLCLPRVNLAYNSLGFHLYEFGDALTTSAFGISEPSPNQEKVTPQLLLVPLLAFDKKCNRLGYGKGFYDRAISELKGIHEVIAIGLAYAAQEFNFVPNEPHDQKLDWVMTEAQSINREAEVQMVNK